jgi:hypothetical protein
VINVVACFRDLLSYLTNAVARFRRFQDHVTAAQPEGSCEVRPGGLVLSAFESSRLSQCEFHAGLFFVVLAGGLRYPFTGQNLEPFSIAGQFKDKQEVRSNEEILFSGSIGRIFCGNGCGGG